MNALLRRPLSLFALATLAIAPVAGADEDWRSRRAAEAAPGAPAPDSTQGDRVAPQRVVPVPEPQRVVPVPRPGWEVDIEVWTDRGQDATYCVGDAIEIYFRTNVDAWVSLYDIDTTGRVQVLYPGPWERSALVRGGRTYRVSPEWGSRLAVVGPEGWEHLRAVAVAAGDGYGYEPHDRRDGDRDRRYDDRGYDDRRHDDRGYDDRRYETHGRRDVDRSDDDQGYDGGRSEGQRIEAPGGTVASPLGDDLQWNQGWKNRSGVRPETFDRELDKRVIVVPRDRRDIDQVSFWVESGRRCRPYGRGW